MNAEHAALRAAVRGLVTAHDDDTGRWSRLCRQIGVAGLTTPERYGGSGAGLAEAMIVQEELGRVLSGVPMLGTLLVTEALRHAGDDTLLPAVCSGDRIAALAWEPDGTGAFRDVLDRADADTLLAVTGGWLYEVDPATVVWQPQPSLDLSRQPATVRLGDPPGRLIGPGIPLDRLRDTACLALAAEQVGAAGRALELTVDHVRTRHQFGRPIGSFQVLQHRLADLYVRVEAARSACSAGSSVAPVAGSVAPAVSSVAPAVSSVAPAVAKITCSETLQAVAAEMVQMHGGIAITWDHDAHRYLRRAWASAQLFGTPATHLARLEPTWLDR